MVIKLNTILILILLNQIPHSDPQMISISGKDLKSINSSWPIDRRWYGVLINDLQQAGANRIFIDLAFANEDIIHPESDRFLYNTLNKFQNVFLLSEKNEIKDDSVRVFGKYFLYKNRFFTPFSYNIGIDNNGLILEKSDTSSLIYFLNDQTGFQNNILIDLPDSIPFKSYNLTEVLTQKIDFKGKDVVLYLSFPGITSYVYSGKNKKAFSTTETQIWIYSQIEKHDYKLMKPILFFVFFFGLCLLPSFTFLLRNQRNILPIISILLNVTIYLIFLSINIYTPNYWLFLNLIPVIQLGYYYYKKRVYLLDNNLNETEKRISVVPDSPELNELKYKLKYYETITAQSDIIAKSDVIEKSGIIYGSNSPLEKVLQKANEVAKNDIPVMIYGESGTGKEKLAQFIHLNSNRADKPFIAVNCGSLNENLIESELFGYEPGAFTGAVKQKVGRFEQANHGILFLDEIGETSPSFQVKLLRVLQEGVFERVGGIKPINVSVRIIAATHRNLELLVKEGKFREDLFYRLNGVTISIPALRYRQNDIPALFSAFLNKIDSSIKVSDQLIDWLKIQTWKGNIRELKSATDRAVINANMNKRSFLIPEDFELPASIVPIQPTQIHLSILEGLRKNQFKHRVISKVSDELSLHRMTVTEYFRGWIIHFLLKNNFEKKSVMDSIKGAVEPENKDQYQNRINEYIDSILSKISEGISEGLTAEQITVLKFKNLPSVFEEDLLQLIELIKDGKMK